MKTQCHLLLLAITIVLFPGCDTNQPEPQPEPNVFDEWVLVKVNNLSQGVIVSPTILSAELNTKKQSTILTYGDSLSLCNNISPETNDFVSFAQEKLKIANLSPYIFLRDGYVMIHWKWRYFFPFSAPLIYAKDNSCFSPDPYINNGPVENQEFYFVALQDNSVDLLNKKWAIKEGQLINLADRRYVRLRDLDKYRGYNGQYDSILRGVYSEGLDAMSCFNYRKDETQVTKYIHLCDSLESVFVETLNRMIQNKDLESWSRIDY